MTLDKARLPAMSTPPESTVADSVLRQPPAEDALAAGLSALYALSQSSRHVFASPLGPLDGEGAPAYLPRFVFFGPHACDESWRLSLMAGLDPLDLRSSRALVALATRLAGDSDAGHALNLSFFPRVAAAGRGLATAHWGRGGPAEIELLRKDARQRAYHGFVVVETAPPDEERMTVRVSGSIEGVLSPAPGWFTPEEERLFPARFEGDPAQRPQAGPLSIADDLPFRPFQVTLRIPAAWSEGAYERAAVTLLERFLTRYRAFQAYGQHL